MFYPETRSESLKHFALVSPELYHLQLVLKNDSLSEDVSDIPGLVSYSTVTLTRYKVRLPAPRVWTMFEKLVNMPTAYYFYIWLDDLENPKHYWAGSAWLEETRSRVEN